MALEVLSSANGLAWAYGIGLDSSIETPFPFAFVNPL